MPQTSTRVVAASGWGAPVHLDSHLVEQAVLLAIEYSSADIRRRFRAERDPIYEVDPVMREGRFEALHALWFDRLGLAAGLLRLLAEQPSIPGRIGGCLIVPATRRKDEHADLRQGRDPGDRPRRPHLVIQILAPTLVDRPSLKRLLRRELVYVADMLDPVFGYDPGAAVTATSGPLASLVRERHELLWRVSVDGRLAARGHLGSTEAERLRGRFRTSFAMLGPAGAAFFDDLFQGPRPTHGELMQLARHPAGEGRGPSGQCPLCGMPAPRDQLRNERLSARASAALRRDFADWQADDGLCSHCADLYELRERAAGPR